jgi:hypothetical protein
MITLSQSCYPNRKKSASHLHLPDSFASPFILLIYYIGSLQTHSLCFKVIKYPLSKIMNLSAMLPPDIPPPLSGKFITGGRTESL